MDLLPRRLGPAAIALTLLASGFATGALAAEPEPEICVISPRLELDARGRVSGLVPTATPSLVVAEALQEVRIERGGRLAWQGQVPPGLAPGLPIRWPLPPLAPGEAVVVRIRPRGAPATAFATVRLRAAPAATLRSSDHLVASLGQNPRAWQVAVERALDQRRFPLAWALLFNPRAPDARGLQELRANLLARGCGPDQG